MLLQSASTSHKLLFFNLGSVRLTASSEVTFASTIAVKTPFLPAKDPRPNDLDLPIVVSPIRPRWVCSHSAGNLQVHCEKTCRTHSLPIMAPKNHPRSGNRPRDSAFAGTKNPPSSRKTAHASASPTAAVDLNATALPIELQQTLLNVVADAFPLAGNETKLKPTIQEVKGHLYKRDFATAFGKQDYLAAYALRWSAARALAYADIFATFDPESSWLGQAPQTGEDGKPISRIVCMGGGAGAEALALAAVMKHHQLHGLHMEAVDVADWSHCLQLLQKSLTTPPPLFKYASESARAVNRSLLEPEQLVVSFRCEDVLEQKQERLKELMVGTQLITLMFTLNELFTTSLSRTTAFLLTLTDVVEPGAYVLVVDSPGSYSEVKLGKDGEAKRYPMKWLLDHTLLEIAGEGKWKKEVGEESKWFRLDSRLKYPIDLEDMRYQIHVYQRGGSTVKDGKEQFDRVEKPAEA